MILLDTSVLVWAAADRERLSRSAASAIRRARTSDGIAISAISLWELALLFSRGRLRPRGSIEDSVQMVIDSVGAVVKPITPAIAALATQFAEDFPRDPPDRIIGATARAEGLTLITRDERIRSSLLLKTLW
ncbi:MAG TPA: type II toxin-antitoxin system VapC family toxin [Terriglobales bacterium]|nr:type II toxin-antitoxin system VapC family toxin [Terriglobales bacterium]